MDVATDRENREFVEAVMAPCPLDEAIVFIRRRISPEDVFDRNQLEAWALENGFSKDE